MMRDIDDVFQKLKPLLGERVDALWLAYQACPEKREDLEAALKILAAKFLDETYEKNKILLEPPPKEIARGEYELATIFYGEEKHYPFGLREDEWIQHVAIFGRSGSGKTNIGFLIIKSLLEKKKPFLVFDWKRNYRDLLSLEEYKNMEVLTVGRNINPFYFNPLIPPKRTEPEVWLKKLIEVLGHAYFLGEGVAYLLLKAINYVYKEYGVYEGNPEKWPTFVDVMRWLENYKAYGRQAMWMDSTKRAIANLCFAGVGIAMNVRKQLPIESILNKNVVFELDALTNSDKTFFIEALLLWIHHYRMAQGEREQFKHAMIIEEAHHILLRKKQELTGEETIMDVILREIRELGESIILIDQHPSLISKPALGNTYTTIALNLKHRDDVNAVGDCMLLDPDEKEYLSKLKIGQGIGKLQGRWEKAFAVCFPLVKVNKGALQDKDLKQ